MYVACGSLEPPQERLDVQTRAEGRHLDVRDLGRARPSALIVCGLQARQARIRPQLSGYTQVSAGPEETTRTSFHVLFLWETREGWLPSGFSHTHACQTFLNTECRFNKHTGKVSPGSSGKAVCGKASVWEGQCGVNSRNSVPSVTALCVLTACEFALTHDPDFFFFSSGV